MVIFLNEERSYLSWVTHHPRGFVLDWLRRPTRKTPAIHRASCREMRRAKTKRSQWTMGRHMKACALDIAELVEWSQQEAGMQPSYCEVCRPNESEPLRTGNDDRHLTRLGKEIVDYVVEGAVIHLDWHDAGYNMTIADIAAGLDKTRAQISSALVRLERDGYLRFSEDVAQQPLPAECRVFPTPEAMRLLPAFESLPKQQVENELDSLIDES